MRSDLTLEPALPRRFFLRLFLAGTLCVGWLLTTATPLGAVEASAPPYGLISRPPAKAYLDMPDHADGPFPRLLSQTGAFQRTQHQKLKVSESLIPYDLNVAFWSDGAVKSRWVSVPDGAKIRFQPEGEWTFPPGTVFVKDFNLVTDETQPGRTRRLETRLLVCDSTGGVYGVTYKWHADNRDADLLTTNLTETISITTATGVRTQSWYYPNRSDCLTCHTPLAGGVLGVKTRQLNRNLTFPSGVTDNQLRAWNHVGLFEPELSETQLATLPKLARADDFARSLEDRTRSYLDANCAHCHRPSGTVASFDARYDTPLTKQNLIGGPILIDEGIDGARAVAPNDIWRSILLMRISRLDGTKMPPLAHSEMDRQGAALLREWIESLAGPRVLPPPEMSPYGGDYARPVKVCLKVSEPDASIRYTLDGSVPTAADLLYEQPIVVAAPTVVRAKVFKPGFTKSITAQEVYNVGE